MPRPSKQPRLFDVANVTTVPGSKDGSPGSISLTRRSSGRGPLFFFQDNTNKQRRTDRENNLRMANDLRRQADDNSGAERDALLQKAQTFFQKVCIFYHGASAGVPRCEKACNSKAVAVFAPSSGPTGLHESHSTLPLLPLA